MDINNVFTNEVTKIDFSLIPEAFQGNTSEKRSMQALVGLTIDRLGRHSAIAQGLKQPITTVDKFRMSSYLIYLLKNPAANGGKGEIVGLLKVGKKNLYLNDPSDVSGRMHQIEPWCVLDFFVEGPYQRSGAGRKLFDYMLEDLQMQPRHLAIDGPSPAMERFMGKSFGVKIQKQANNFAIADTFFSELKEVSASAKATPTPTSSGAGRFSAVHPKSDIGTVIHGRSPVQNISASRVEVEGGKSPAVERAPEVEEIHSTQVEDEEVPPVEEVAAPAERVSPAVMPERPCTLAVETPAAPDSAAPSPAGSVLSRRDSQLTDKGFFDVKFYHNKLW